MSVLPVSDALRRLEEDGLVESRPRAGTRVRVPSESDVRELYELREALETQAARLFTERATSAQRRELKRLADEVDLLFSRLPTHRDDPAFRYHVHKTHVAFHTCDRRTCAQRALETDDRTKTRADSQLAVRRDGRRTALPLGFHATLADALVSGDADRADAAMRAHVRYGLAEIAGHIGALAASEWRERRKAVDGRRA